MRMVLSTRKNLVLEEHDTQEVGEAAQPRGSQGESYHTLYLLLVLKRFAGGQSELMIQPTIRNVNNRRSVYHPHEHRRTCASCMRAPPLRALSNVGRPGRTKYVPLS